MKITRERIFQQQPNALRAGTVLTASVLVKAAMTHHQEGGRFYFLLFKAGYG
ncbi:MAG: hypothetical protein HYU85_02025 [Chloroflexi bacterium]|nr:hypothetical protein [Chloroflexota bacterium]MBI3040263.1 hypothetical protein [Chloroflexota bacterium]MBI3931124.1 hypothetical protein [Chloroflexota bacterium]